jgi:hypothetical protein
MNLIATLLAVHRLRKKARKIGKDAPARAAALIRSRADNLDASIKSPYINEDEREAAQRDVDLLRWSANVVEYVFRLGKTELAIVDTPKPALLGSSLATGTSERNIVEDGPSTGAAKLRYVASMIEFEMQRAAADDTLTEAEYAENVARITELREKADGLCPDTKTPVG